MYSAVSCFGVSYPLFCFGSFLGSLVLFFFVPWEGLMCAFVCCFAYCVCCLVVRVYSFPPFHIMPRQRLSAFSSLAMPVARVDRDGWLFQESAPRIPWHLTSSHGGERRPPSLARTLAVGRTVTVAITLAVRPAPGGGDRGGGCRLWSNKVAIEPARWSGSAQTRCRRTLPSPAARCGMAVAANARPCRAHRQEGPSGGAVTRRRHHLASTPADVDSLKTERDQQR